MNKELGKGFSTDALLPLAKALHEKKVHHTNNAELLEGLNGLDPHPLLDGAWPLVSIPVMARPLAQLDSSQALLGISAIPALIATFFLGRCLLRSLWKRREPREVA